MLPSLSVHLRSVAAELVGGFESTEYRTGAKMLKGTLREGLQAKMMKHGGCSSPCMRIAVATNAKHDRLRVH